MRGPIIDGALLIVAGAILRARGSAAVSAPDVSRTCLRLVARFREAADRDWNKHLQVSAYAGMLGTSPSRLRAACVGVTGQGPIAMLQRRVMLGAQRALIYSSLSAGEVALAAGFDDAA